MQPKLYPVFSAAPPAPAPSTALPLASAVPGPRPAPAPSIGLPASLTPTAGPYIVYMLQEIDILEDWTAIKKVGPAAHSLQPVSGEGLAVWLPPRHQLWSLQALHLWAF